MGLDQQAVHTRAHRWEWARVCHTDSEVMTTMQAVPLNVCIFHALLSTTAFCTPSKFRRCIGTRGWDTGWVGTLLSVYSLAQMAILFKLRGTARRGTGHGAGYASVHMAIGEPGCRDAPVGHRGEQMCRASAYWV